MHLKCPNGSVTSDSLEVCTILNKVFQKVFTKESAIGIPSANSYQGEVLQKCEFTVEDVRKAIRNLRAESAPGPDGVHPTVLKEYEEVIAYPL